MTINESMLQILAFELALRELSEKEREIVLAMEEKIKEIISASPMEGIIAIGHIGVLLQSGEPIYISQVFGDKSLEMVK